jgi:integrase
MDEEGAERSCPLGGFSGRVAVRGRGPPLRLLPEPHRGVHPSTAQKILGHSDIRMTLAIYTHGTDGMQDAATAALESAFS